MANKIQGEIYVGGTGLGGAFGGGWIGSGTVTRRYEGAIPVADLTGGLLNWEPLKVPNANLVPVSVDQPFDQIVDGQAYKTVIRDGYRGVVRSDNHNSLGVFREDWDGRSYQDLVKFNNSAFQGSLPIYNAGLLGGGRQFFIQYGMDQTMHDTASGVQFMPFLLFRSSLDGSLANRWSGGSTVLICNNMFAGAGTRFSAKRSKRNLDNKMNDLQRAFGVLELESESMIQFLHNTVDLPLSRSQWIKVLDQKIPMPDEATASKAAVTRAENRRNYVDALYQTDPMVSPWTGTAFGAIQAFNTERHYGGSIRGGVSRTERVFEHLIKDDLQASDASTVEALQHVLGRDLIPA